MENVEVLSKKRTTREGVVVCRAKTDARAMKVCRWVAWNEGATPRSLLRNHAGWAAKIHINVTEEAEARFRSKFEN